MPIQNYFILLTYIYNESDWTILWLIIYKILTLQKHYLNTTGVMF